MKKVLFVLLFFLTLSSFSQGLFNSYKKGKVILRSGDEIGGLIKISGKKIKFKKSKDNKKVIYTYKKARRVKFTNGDEYHYKIKSRTILLLKNDIKGKLNLYTSVGTTPGLMGPNGMMMGGGGTYTIYYIGKGDSDFIDILPKNPKKKKFRKIMTKLTKDCPKFTELIKDRESVKENFAQDYSGVFRVQGDAVEKMVNYYNRNCN